MTVNTNGTKPYNCPQCGSTCVDADTHAAQYHTVQWSSDDWREERMRDQIDTIEKMVEETRDSQLRTEKMVTDFMSAVQNNPMLRAMGAKFGV